MNARLEICVDCLLISANGEDDPYVECLPEAKERYRRALERYRAVLVPEISDGENHAFSRASCDFCGLDLAGARYPAMIYSQRKEQK